MKLPLSMYPHSTAQSYQFRLTQYIVRPQQLANWSRISQTFVKCEGTFPSRPANWPYLQPAEFSSAPSRHVPIWPSYLPTATLYQLSFCLQFLNEIPVYVSLLSSPLRLSNFMARSKPFLCKSLNIGLQNVNSDTVGPRAAETDRNCIASE
jgi:hypothetical protein